MLPIYAIDAGRFLQFHVQGEGQYDYPWEIQPLVAPAQDGDTWRQSLFDKSFRTDFTRRLGPLRVLGKVPGSGATIRNNWDFIERIGPGSLFRFRIKRCHLSEGWSEPGPGIVCEEEPVQFDLMSEFRLPGEIFLPRKDLSASLVEVPADVPGRWITHAILGGWSDAEPERLVPVPRWSLDDVAESSPAVQ